MKSRGDRLEHRAVVDERGHQGALFHRPFRPTEVRRFGEGHSGWMPEADPQIQLATKLHRELHAPAQKAAKD
jgi:hypothetical protein